MFVGAQRFVAIDWHLAVTESRIKSSPRFSWVAGTERYHTLKRVRLSGTPPRLSLTVPMLPSRRAATISDSAKRAGKKFARVPQVAFVMQNFAHSRGHRPHGKLSRLRNIYSPHGTPLWSGSLKTPLQGEFAAHTCVIGLSIFDWQSPTVD